ncbi:MAG: PAM68 family protein [Prochlorococcus marinus CUG1438]|nr:PAM68 family protein [Prochlorococcus marinus CUG1438]
MKKKQAKKKILKRKKKTLSNTAAFSKIDNELPKSIIANSQKSGIPKYVADRMARRIFIAAGIPTIMGMSVFVVSYIIVTRNIAEIPPSSTIAISALFFLLGLAGLSFGILSASWDKEPGSFFGVENIPMNIKRAKAAFKPATQNFEENN